MLLVYKCHLIAYQLIMKFFKKYLVVISQILYTCIVVNYQTRPHQFLRIIYTNYEIVKMVKFYSVLIVVFASEYMPLDI